MFFELVITYFRAEITEEKFMIDVRNELIMQTQKFYISKLHPERTLRKLISKRMSGEIFYL